LGGFQRWAHQGKNIGSWLGEKLNNSGMWRGEHQSKQRQFFCAIECGICKQNNNVNVPVCDVWDEKRVVGTGIRLQPRRPARTPPCRWRRGGDGREGTTHTHLTNTEDKGGRPWRRDTWKQTIGSHRTDSGFGGTFELGGMPPGLWMLPEDPGAGPFWSPRP